MREVEVKILDISREQVEGKLVALGAKKTFDGELYAVWFDTPEGRLRGEDKTLRLRREGDVVKLSCKQGRKNTGAKILNELEVIVDDFKATQAILCALGFAVTRTMRKHRTSYALGNNHAEIDAYGGDYAFIPPFLEIEGQDEDTVYAFVERLGFGRDACKGWGVGQLIRHYSP